jgi:hypothetical protein
VVAIYRATPELRPAPRRRELPRATVVDRVPTDLANEVRTRQQADVSAVPVYRGPKVNEAAKSRGARAFAAGGAVFLPDEAGPVDSPKARGLLAHELTHAVQQRTFGPRLPAPESSIGRRLEAEAQAAERFYSGEAGAAEPPPLIHAPTPAPASQPEPDLSAMAQLATELAPAPQSSHSLFDSAQTAEVGRIATDSAKHVVAEWKNPTLQKQDGPSGAGAGPAAAGAHPAAAGATPARGGAGFNAASRRDQLITQTLAMRNAALLGGEAAVTELSDDEMAAINNQVATEAAQNGVTVPSNEPPAQHYEPNSGKAWMHALTGMNMNYGLGLTGFNEKVGSENSWWGSETGDKRPLDKRLADQVGLINENTETQFDTDTWWQDDKKDDKKGDAAAAAGGADQQQPQHEESLYGRPNPDKSIVDASRLDLDELATRLYDRLRSRLRTELLVDRERAGLLTDFR